LNIVDDPSKLYSYQTGNAVSLKANIVARRGSPASNSEPDVDITARLRNKYYMNVSESIGFFGESSSKNINTVILGEIKLEMIFISQIASCILGSSVPADIQVYEQTATTLESQTNNSNTTFLDTDISAGLLVANAANKIIRRGNIQNACCETDTILIYMFYIMMLPILHVK
jgi:hypothetical protein